MTTQAQIIKSMAIAKFGWGANTQDLSALIDELMLFMAWDGWDYVVNGSGEKAEINDRFRLIEDSSPYVSCNLALTVPAMDGITQRRKRTLILSVRNNKDYRRGRPLAVTIRDASSVRTAAPTDKDGSIVNPRPCPS